MVTADELQSRAFVLPATPQHSGTVIKAAQVASVCGINCVSADSDSDYSDSEGDTVAALYERNDDAVRKANVQKVQEQDSFCKQMKLSLVLLVQESSRQSSADLTKIKSVTLRAAVTR
jgi:hypothetical protein